MDNYLNIIFEGIEHALKITEDINTSEFVNAIVKYLKDKLPVHMMIAIIGNLYSFLAKQGTERWLMERKIGGSSAASILGKNKYSSPLDTAKHILGFKNFKGNLYTMWGNVCEDIAVNVIKFIHGEDISFIELGSVPGYRNDEGKVLTSYSPDGIMHIKHMDKFCDYAPCTEGKIGLLEIKCPFNRIPQESVPTHYVPQVYMGMKTLPFVDYALFADFLLRPCSIEEFGNNTLCRRSTGYKMPMYLTFLGFYGDFKIRSRAPKANFKSIAKYIKDVNPDQRPNAILSDIRHILDDFSTVEKVMASRDFFATHKIDAPSRDIEDFFGNVIVKTDLVDLRGTLNNHHKICTEKEYERVMNSAVKGRTNVYNGRIWDCQKMHMEDDFYKKELESELAKFTDLHHDAYGVMVIKVMDAKFCYLPKDKSYTEFETVDFNQIIDFAEKMQMVKTLPIKEQKKIIKTLFA